MDRGQIHIVSDGTAQGTKVTGPDGKPLPGVLKVEIQPVEPLGAVSAVVTFGNVALGPAGVEIVGELEEGA
jgi:hypothetical protein